MCERYFFHKITFFRFQQNKPSFKYLLDLLLISYLLMKGYRNL